MSSLPLSDCLLFYCPHLTKGWQPYNCESLLFIWFCPQKPDLYLIFLWPLLWYDYFMRTDGSDKLRVQVPSFNHGLKANGLPSNQYIAIIFTTCHRSAIDQVLVKLCLVLHYYTNGVAIRLNRWHAILRVVIDHGRRAYRHIPCVWKPDFNTSHQTRHFGNQVCLFMVYLVRI